MTDLKVFIAYSWDNDQHKEWVLNLSEKLVNYGIDVFLDQYDLSAGKQMTHFMEKAAIAHKVLVIMTTNYKIKADKREGGVGYEYSIISEDLFRSEPDNSRIIPILRNGDNNSSCPIFMKNIIFHDMRNNELFDSTFFQLTQLIQDKPLLTKPTLGKIPNDEDISFPDINRTLTALKEKEEHINKKNMLFESIKGVSIFTELSIEIVSHLEKIIENYKNNFGIQFWIRKEVYPNSKIYFSTGGYTSIIASEYEAVNSARNACITLSFFKGLVGFDQINLNEEKPSIIYQSKYLFDFDTNMNPIFIKLDNNNVRIRPNQLAMISFRDLITRVMKDRDSNLS